VELLRIIHDCQHPIGEDHSEEVRGHIREEDLRQLSLENHLSLMLIIEAEFNHEGE